MIWNWYKDNWLVSRMAAYLFFVSTLFVLSLTPLFWGWLDPGKMAFWSIVFVFWYVAVLGAS
jgi:hypothetical protein